jgi:hypothetical protein
MLVGGRLKHADPLSVNSKSQVSEMLQDVRTTIDTVAPGARVYKAVQALPSSRFNPESSNRIRN